MKIISSLSLACALLLGPSCPAGAQELASTFDQLRVLVKQGDTLTVTDTAGRQLVGRVAGLTSTSLDLQIAQTIRALAESDVRTIRLKRADSLADGARVGFYIGAGLGLLTGLAWDDLSGGDAVGFAVGSTIIYGAMGAGIGVFVDGLRRTNDVIFSRSTGRTTASVGPLHGGSGRGVRLSIGF